MTALTKSIILNMACCVALDKAANSSDVLTGRTGVKRINVTDQKSYAQFEEYLDALINDETIKEK